MDVPSLLLPITSQLLNLDGVEASGVAQVTGNVAQLGTDQTILSAVDPKLVSDVRWY